MTPEQRAILKQLPDAICISQKIPGGIRYVVRPSAKVANPIGIGCTERAAWIAAVNRVKVEVKDV